MHISGSTILGPDPDNKVPVADVEEAIKLGADAVSIHVNIGSQTEPQQLREFGKTAKICEEWGIPLLAMMYPRGGKEINQFDVEFVKHVARIGAELGADIIKTNYTGSPDSFKKTATKINMPATTRKSNKTINLLVTIWLLLFIFQQHLSL